MTVNDQLTRKGLEILDAHPAVDVPEAEYRRLLGYPSHHVPDGRADELAAWARHWFATHGRPWLHAREAELRITDGTLHLDGVAFESKRLHEHLRRTGAQRALLVAVSAGRDCEEQARALWEESKPDEYFFLEVFGSAVVEHLAATLNGRLCDRAGHEGMMAVAHYSPGYTGWDVADQNKLFELMVRGLTQSFPGPLEVLPSGMLRPKKSLLAVVGLAPATGRESDRAFEIPCARCSFSPCHYRRTPCRSDAGGGAVGPRVAVRSTTTDQVAAPVRYTISPHALQKWAKERVTFEQKADGPLLATFRFDGTTCSNLGQPLAFDYVVALGDPADRYTVLAADCRPAPGDEGHTQMCAYLSDATTLMDAIAAEKPLLGRPLHDVFSWARPAAPSGCYCSAETRAHKWGLALEAIHFALAQSAPSGRSDAS